MYFLEDFMEKIEPLPSKVVNSMSRVKELDEQVQVSMNRVQNNIDDLFSNAKDTSVEEFNAGFAEIMKDGDIALEKSAEKVKIAGEVQSLLTKYISQLDVDILSFKNNLDCNISGASEIIEQRVSEIFDNSNIANQKENECRSNNLDMGELNNVLSMISSELYDSDSDVSVSWDASHADQAIALPELQASFGIPKASGGPVATITSADNNPTVAASIPKKKRAKLNPKRRRARACRREVKVVADSTAKPAPRFCLCDEVSYGEMIACDNKKCLREWFHYGCVGIEITPQGDWYCPLCIQGMKKRSK